MASQFYESPQGRGKFMKGSYRHIPICDMKLSENYRTFPSKCSPACTVKDDWTRLEWWGFALLLIKIQDGGRRAAEECMPVLLMKPFIEYACISCSYWIRGNPFLKSFNKGVKMFCKHSDNLWQLWMQPQVWQYKIIMKSFVYLKTLQAWVSRNCCCKIL